MSSLSAEQTKTVSEVVPQSRDAPETVRFSDSRKHLVRKTVASMEDPETSCNGASNEHHVDPEAELRLLKKLDWRLLPIVFTCYLMSYLDRSNIGNAKIAGMQEDLHFSPDGNDYSWLLTIFYIAYIVFECGTLMWKIVPPHIWGAAMVAGWGLASTLQSTVVSWSGLMALRFLLGAFEACFGPAIPYYLSFFYLRKELGWRIGWFLSAGPLGTCFAGALAYGITSGHVGIANWRLLFLVEGLPCFIVAAVILFYLPDSPAEASFLSDEDRAVARSREIIQVGGDEPSSSNRIGSVVWSDILAAFLDVKNYLTAMMYFSCNVSFSSLPVFLPTIITEMGFTPIHAQGLSAPPYFISFLIVLGSTYYADRYAQRGLTITVLSFVGAIGYIILAATKATAPRYFGVYLAAAGVYPAISNILPWVLNNQGSDTKRGAGITILNLVGQCGPLLGTRVYPTIDQPYYRRGMWTCAAFMLFNGVLAIILRVLLVWENKKLDEKYGPVDRGADGKELATAGIENDGSNFRYIL